MINMACNQILLEEQPCGVRSFILELVFEHICSLNIVLYFYFFSFLIYIAFCLSTT